jgi:hypothetical protein
LGDFGTTFLLRRCSKPEIAKGGNLPTAAAVAAGRQ